MDIGNGQGNGSCLVNSAYGPGEGHSMPSLPIFVDFFYCLVESIHPEDKLKYKFAFNLAGLYS